MWRFPGTEGRGRESVCEESGLRGRFSLRVGSGRGPLLGGRVRRGEVVARREVKWAVLVASPVAEAERTARALWKVQRVYEGIAGERRTS